MNTAITYPSFSLAYFWTGLQSFFASIIAVHNEPGPGPGDYEKGAPDSSSVLDGIFGKGKTLADIGDDDEEPEPDAGKSKKKKPIDDDDDEEFDEFADFEDEDDEEEDDDEEDDDDSEEEDDDEGEEEDDDEDDDDDSEEDDDDSEEDDDDDDSEEDEDDSEEDEDDSEEDDDERESVARQQARERGRQLKVLQAEFDTLELEAETLRETNETLKEEVRKLSTAHLSPDDDPEFATEKQKVLAAVTEASMDLPRNSENLRSDYGPLYDRYSTIRNLSNAQERQDEYNKFKADIAAQYSSFEEPLDELVGEDRREALDTVNGVLKLLKDQSARTEELIRKEAELTKKAAQGQIALGVEEYENQKKKVQAVLETLGTVDEDAKGEQAETLEHMLAVMAQGNKEKEKQLKKAKQAALDMVLGARPFTQSEIDAMAEKGQDIAEKKRQQVKRVELLRKEALAKFALFLSLEDEVTEALKQASTEARKKASKEKSLEALGKARRKKKVNKRPNKKKSASRFRSAEEAPNPAFKIFD